jgi:hypothetical protein
MGTDINPTWRPNSNVEYDYIWIIVTVGRRKNSYDLRVREPKSLQQNQFAYRLKIPFDRNAWFDRIEEVDMITVDPPAFPKPDITATIVEPPTAQKVLDTLKGKDPPIHFIPRTPAAEKCHQEFLIRCILDLGAAYG